jgi:excisionase family DNA binding protein
MAARKKEQQDLESKPDLQVEPRFYTLEQTAAYLNVSVPQVYALVRSGELPGVKIGGRGIWRVDRHKLEAYLEKLEETTRAWALANPLQKRDADTDAQESL